MNWLWAWTETLDVIRRDFAAPDALMERYANFRFSQNQSSVYRATELLQELLAADLSHGLGKMIGTLGRLDLLIVDELGYIPMDTRRANLFFQLVKHMCARASMIITT